MGTPVFNLMHRAVPITLLAITASGLRLDAEQDHNVYGHPLEKCDRSVAHDPNFPSTGFMRGDMCTATSADAGSHYVCVNLPDGTAPSGKHYSPFWTETGQARTPEEATTWPLAGPWCICEWAFARMFAQHPDFEELLNCGAVNEWVIENYSLDVPDQRGALAAVCRKCDVAGKAVKDSLKTKCTKAMQQ